MNQKKIRGTGAHQNSNLHWKISMILGSGLKTTENGTYHRITSTGTSITSRTWLRLTILNRCSSRGSKRLRKLASMRHPTLLLTAFRLELSWALLQGRGTTSESYLPLVLVMVSKRSLWSSKNVRS